MTDNDIIKGLYCCISDGYTCPNCPYQALKHIVDDEFETMPNGKSYDDYSCDEWLKLDLFSLINRQQAENEKMRETVRYILEGAKLAIAKAKVEAIKEFAERVKGINLHLYVEYDEKAMWGYEVLPYLFNEDIDNLVKEMVGADNA